MLQELEGFTEETKREECNDSLNGGNFEDHYLNDRSSCAKYTVSENQWVQSTSKDALNDFDAIKGKRQNTEGADAEWILGVAMLKKVPWKA